MALCTISIMMMVPLKGCEDSLALQFYILVEVYSI